MKVWISKYALTDGIQERDAEPTKIAGMVNYGNGFYGLYAHGEGREWHKTFESTAKKAEEMRKAKIASLRKSLAKMEALAFKAPNDQHEGCGKD